MREHSVFGKDVGAPEAHLLSGAQRGGGIRSVALKLVSHEVASALVGFRGMVVDVGCRCYLFTLRTPSASLQRVAALTLQTVGSPTVV